VAHTGEDDRRPEQAVDGEHIRRGVACDVSSDTLETRASDTAIDVEELLIKTFVDNPKNENDASDARAEFRMASTTRRSRA
jgi:hypothetical protein